MVGAGAAAVNISLYGAALAGASVAPIAAAITVGGALFGAAYKTILWAFS